MRIVLSILSATILLASCASSGASTTQVFAAMSGLNAGATLGGAIGGLTSRSHRGYHMGTTIGALSGAAIGAVATMPRKKRVETTETVESYEAPKRKRGSFAPTATLSGMRRDVRVTNVTFRDSSGDGVLQPGEAAIVSYDIINVTPRAISLLVPRMELSAQTKRIHISPMQNIVDVPSGEGVRYSATLTADSRLKSGEAQLTLYLSGDNGASFTEMNTIQIRTKK